MKQLFPDNKIEDITSLDFLKNDHKGSRVLIVDDHPLILELIEIYLSDMAELCVTTVTNAEDAIDAIKKDKYDLIITDLHMPGIDGIELSRQIRSTVSQEDLPIILMTGSSYEDYKDDFDDSIINACISKPLTKETLFHQILLQLDLHKILKTSTN